MVLKKWINHSREWNVSLSEVRLKRNINNNFKRNLIVKECRYELLGITPKLRPLLVHKNKTKAYYYWSFEAFIQLIIGKETVVGLLLTFRFSFCILFLFSFCSILLGISAQQDKHNCIHYSYSFLFYSTLFLKPILLLRA